MSNPNAKRAKAKGTALAPAPATATAKDRSAVTVGISSEAERDQAVARKLTRPEVGSAAVIEAWAQGTHDVNALVTELASQVEAINSGQMARAEGMLIAQAHTLDAIFVNLMRRAMNQTTMPHWDAYMRIGLKAQSQCRSTLQALADLKNPPLVFAKQANIANGPQQVNNGVSGDSASTTRPRAPAHEKDGIEQSRLLDGQKHGGTYLDAGAAATTAAGNPAVEAVGAVNRPAQPRRKGNG